VASNGDLLGRRRQVVSAVHALPAVHDSGVAQIEQDQLEELGGDVVLVRNLRDLHHTLAVRGSQVDQGLEPVFAALAELHTSFIMAQKGHALS
jgi:hypothetical protein